MRELTPEEIKNAPGWASDYAIIENHVRWSNDEFFEWNTSSTGGVRARRHAEFMKEPKPIPGKEFAEKDELISLLQMCVNDMYSPSGKIKKKTAKKLMAACEKGLVNYPE